IEELQKPILYVEDIYEAIYKIGFLKCRGIEFQKETLDKIFVENSPFLIRRSGGAGSVGGVLSMATTDGYDDKKIIGLFDYDEEGCKNFYLLKKRCDGAWNEPILGEKRSGFYKKRKNHNCFYALLLPIPERLESLTRDINRCAFTSFVEIENLINITKLQELNCVETKTILDKTYYKMKDNLKSKAIDKFSDLTKEDFLDFIPLFDKLNELFGLIDSQNVSDIKLQVVNSA
ncbi:MAG TPA: hypothetical protein VK941_00555, partial [Gillisia sp.]|nr:hypothetical protein [Gillisia sp.]